ncbi:MAG: response regulator [Anaerolineaceae bacterium]|nr:response regulator [Anaerolineaceae bacterium]
MSKKILIADDESAIRDALAELFGDQGFKVATARDGLEAVQHLSNSDIDIAVLDIRMPGLDGLQVLARARQIAPETQIIMITAYGTVEDAVDAINRGAMDYVTKPLVFDDLLIKVQRLLNLRRLTTENRLLLSELEGQFDFKSIIGQSGALRNVLNLALKLARTRTTALISGESGTGKELIARAIHYGGPDRRGRFVAINCAALPESLVESELFGHKRGAFTGASHDKLGLFSHAEGGTIFLDEISTMPLAIQAKLLRAIEEKRVLPVGGTEPLEIKARIICATNHNLRQEVEAGRFRDDLYYRLNVVEIVIPPLRQRREDIPPLVDHFLAKYNQSLNKHCPGVSEGAMRVMMTYSWPGNVRELENAVERAIIFTDDGPIQPHHLPFFDGPVVADHDSPNDLKSVMKVYERQHILQVLRSHNYDKNKTARVLGIGLSSLYRKMDELDIDKRAEPQESGDDGNWSKQGSVLPGASHGAEGQWPRNPVRNADRPQTSPADEDRVIGS